MSTILPKAHSVTRKAIQELLKDSQWIVDEELSSKVAPNKVYVHPDGRLLNAFTFGNGKLYPKREEFNKLLQIMEENKGRGAQHILAGRFPYGEEFPQHVPQLIDDLATLLKIPRSELDGSMESLSNVEAKVKRLGRKKCLEAPIFPALVAYMGEVMRLQIRGRWDMRLAISDDKTWEPWIFDSEGRSCTPFIDLYDMLYEPSEPISIRGTAAFLITHRRVRPTSKPNPDPSTLPTLRMTSPDKTRES